ncbi:MAG: hypothetical protein AB7S70_07440 [Hyphomicrobium sp.]|uniref:hypothetical protein n=1 Tax=Hyphomicrobium sp. TaxID=82 RepID=UPI003D0D5B44
MKAILPLALLLTLGAAPAFADHESFKDGPVPERPGPSLYERIAAHYGPLGRDVKEEFREGPCTIEREWEKDGDYYERIKCRGPRD